MFILINLLNLDTPWAEPTAHDPEFRMFLSKYSTVLDYEPWNKFSPTVLCEFSFLKDDAKRRPLTYHSSILALLRGILNVDPSQRFTIDQIKSHEWFQRPNMMMRTDGKCDDPIALAARMMEKLTVAGEMDMVNVNPISYSQPEVMRMSPQDSLADNMMISFSQPQPNNPGLFMYGDSQSQVMDCTQNVSFFLFVALHLSETQRTNLQYLNSYNADDHFAISGHRNVSRVSTADYPSTISLRVSQMSWNPLLYRIK